MFIIWCGNVCHNVAFLDETSTCFPSLVPCLKFTLCKVAAKTGNDVSLVLKDSDTESGKPQFVHPTFRSDGQKTDSLNIISFIGIKSNQVPHLTQDNKWESDSFTIRHHKSLLSNYVHGLHSNARTRLPKHAL